MVSTSERIPHLPSALHEVLILDLLEPSLGQITGHPALSTLLSGRVIFSLLLHQLIDGGKLYSIIAKLRLRLIVIIVI